MLPGGTFPALGLLFHVPQGLVRFLRTTKYEISIINTYHGSQSSSLLSRVVFQWYSTFLMKRKVWVWVISYQITSKWVSLSELEWLPQNRRGQCIKQILWILIPLRIPRFSSPGKKLRVQSSRGPRTTHSQRGPTTILRLCYRALHIIYHS